MNFSTLFIHRPIATTLLMLAVFITGCLGYRLLPQAPLPQVDYPTIQITTLYPGASPDVIASAITAPLERQMGQLPGLEQMWSTSSGGSSVILLRFGLDLKLEIAEQQVQAAINAAATFLPNDVPAPPIYNKVNPADAPILSMALTSDTLALPVLQDLANTRLAPKLSQITGVGLVTLAGGQKPAVRIQVQTDALASQGLTLEDIRTAVIAHNVNQAKGSFDGQLRATTIDANDQLSSAVDYGKMIIASKNGAVIRLSDVARIEDGVENVRLAAWANQVPAIILNIQRQPGANTIETVDRIKQILPNIQASLPGAVNVSVLSDRTITIRAAIHSVASEMLLAVFLVVLVIFLFLGQFRATLIAGIAVPLSLMGTLGLMYLLDFTLNNLSLMALTIATGFVVDDAIVMIENITRYLEKGETPLKAAILGASQISFTIISLTVSLIAALIPLLFMREMIGRLFQEFAITLSLSILVSAFVSLILTPMMCAHILSSHSDIRDTAHTKLSLLSRWQAWSAHSFSQLQSLYADALDWVLARQTATLLFTIATLLLTGLLAWIVPKGFFPLQDTGGIQVIFQAPQDISFTAMSERQQIVAKALLQDPAVDTIASLIGVDGTNPTPNQGRMFLSLKPLATRPHVRELIPRLQERMKGISEVSVWFQPVQDLAIEDKITPAQYQLTLDSNSSAQLSDWTTRLLSRLYEQPSLQEVGTDMQNGGRQLYIKINRDLASRMGITMADVDNALYSAYGQRLISTIFTQTNQYRVVLEMDSALRREPQDVLTHLYVPSRANGVTTPVPLSTIANIEERRINLQVNRLNQFPTNTIYFNVVPGYALGDAITGITATLQELQLPSSIRTQFQGASLAFNQSLDNQQWLIIAALITLYIVLGILYESYIHPITILSTLPGAGIGAILALMISGLDLNMIAVIGIVLLIGIVKKNAIMMIDFALDAQRHQGLSPHEAIRTACLLRLRPILMTTCAALFAALPLMLGTGIGSELRNPLGVTLVGGLLLSQLLTLFTTPVIYLRFTDWVQTSSNSENMVNSLQRSPDEKK